MVKKTDEGLVLNAQAQTALDDMLSNMIDLINMIKITSGVNAIDKLKDSNSELIKKIELIEKEFSRIKKESARGAEISPQELSTLSNALNKVQDQIYTIKFQAKGAALIERLLKVTPVLKNQPYATKHTDLSEQQQMDVMRNGVKSIVDNIQHNATILRSNAAPKHRTLWERFTRACVNFARTCKDKILSLFGKKKQEVTPPKPLGFREAQMEETKKDPQRRLHVMSAHAAADKARRMGVAKAKKEAEAGQTPTPTPSQRPEPPERPSRKKNP